MEAALHNFKDYKLVYHNRQIYMKACNMKLNNCSPSWCNRYIIQNVKIKRTPVHFLADWKQNGCHDVCGYTMTGCR